MKTHIHGLSKRWHQTASHKVKRVHTDVIENQTTLLLNCIFIGCSFQNSGSPPLSGLAADLSKQKNYKSVVAIKVSAFCPVID